MTIPQIISLTIIITIVIFSLKKGSDLFSPARVFLLVWSVSIFLAEFKFSGYQHQWSAYSWFVLLTGLLSFLLGLYISYILNADRKLLSVSEIRNKIKANKEYDKRKLFTIITLLFFAYIISLVLEFILRGYIPIFHPRPDRARIDFAMFGLHLFVNQMPVILFLIVEYFIHGFKSKNKTFILSFYFIITFFTYFLILDRFSYVYWLVMSFALLYYMTRIINIRTTIISFSFFYIFFSFVTSIRLSKYATQYLYVISRMKFSPEFASFTGPYMYLVMNLENFSRGIEKLEIHTYSAMTFDWIYALFGLKHWMKDYFGYIYNPFLISNYTTYPFLWNYYLDFGLIGIFIFPLIIGIIVGLIYYNMRTKGTVAGVVAYCFCIFFVIISFFTNVLTMLSIVSNIIVLWFVHKFFISKQISSISFN